MGTLDTYPEWEFCKELLLDNDVSEIEVNGPNEFFIKRRGKREHLDKINLGQGKLGEERYYEGIEYGLVPLVRQLSSFERQGYLFEGPLDYTLRGQRIRGRCHIVLPPACDSPQITIAKKSTSLATLDDIASRGSMSADMLIAMKIIMQSNATMVFSGGTGAGKTTMLEACSKLIPNSVRIGVAEDTPELSLTQPNVTYLHSVPWQPGMDPNSVATLSWVVAQFQRMRTDRLIIGETRGKEFADFLVAANSGMEGSLTTIHANTPQRCLAKMTNFALKGSERQPTRAINTDIANAIDFIIQLIILPDGRHKIAAIEEVTETVNAKEEATITTSTLFQYDVNQDRFQRANNPSDTMRKRFESKGIDLSPILSAKIGEWKPPMGASTPGPGMVTRGRGLPIPGQQRGI